MTTQRTSHYVYSAGQEVYISGHLDQVFLGRVHRVEHDTIEVSVIDQSIMYLFSVGDVEPDGTVRTAERSFWKGVMYPASHLTGRKMWIRQSLQVMQRNMHERARVAVAFPTEQNTKAFSRAYEELVDALISYRALLKEEA